jgi:hypothetical protein
VRCDLRVPICTACSRARKECQYGLQLSWPKGNDKRRSQVSNKTVAWRLPTRHGAQPHIFNVGDADIQLFLSSDEDLSVAEQQQLQHHKGDWFRPSYEYPTFASLPQTMSWILPEFGEFDSNLMSYCTHNPHRFHGNAG